MTASPPVGFIGLGAMGELARPSRRRRQALEAGFAIGCRTALMKSGTIEVLGLDDNLPALPSIGFALLIPRPLGAAARRLASLVREVVGSTASASRPAQMQVAS